MRDESSGGSSPRRPHTNGSNGFRPESLRITSIPLPEVAEEPVDLVAVQADDELINALAAGMTVSAPGVGGYDTDDKVAALLAAWRAEVNAEPVPELVDLDTATSAVASASRPVGSRARHLVPLAAAAALLVFTIAGVSIGAQDAKPGDMLWDVSRVLYSERAESLVAAQRVESRIAEAKDALSRGEPIVAARVLADIENDLLVVRAEEGQAELAAVQDFLEAKAAETPPGTPADLDSPLRSDPTRPVPPGAGANEPVRPDPATLRPSDPGSTSSVPATPPGADVRYLDPGSAGPVSGVVPSVAPTVDPGPPTGGGEGGPDGPAGVTPSGTAEGSADPTTMPGQSMGVPGDGSASGPAGTVPPS